MSNNAKPADNYLAKSDKTFGIALCYMCVNVLSIIGGGVSPTNMAGLGLGTILTTIALPISLIFVIIQAYKTIRFGGRHKKLLFAHIIGLISLILLPSIFFAITMNH